jgi:diphthamide synthase subunit DPH2
MVWYTLEQRVFLYDTYVKSLRKCRRKFRDERIPRRQTIHNLVNKLKSTGLLINKKQKQKRRVLTKEKLDEIGARLEDTPRKSRLGQETGVSKSDRRRTTQLLILDPIREK